MSGDETTVQHPFPFVEINSQGIYYFIIGSSGKKKRFTPVGYIYHMGNEVLSACRPGTHTVWQCNI